MAGSLFFADTDCCSANMCSLPADAVNKLIFYILKPSVQFFSKEKAEKENGKAGIAASLLLLEREGSLLIEWQ